jgi:ABC-type multidrug transport system ATPase subunit
MTDVERMAGRIIMLHDGSVLVNSGTDDLREEFSIALVPHVNGEARRRLAAHTDCLATRDRADAVHAVFRRSPDQTRKLLEAEMKITGANCRSVALEEMFIELVEGQQ